mgnify:CR=1 FL=1
MNSANEMNVEFDSVAKNESFARVIVASFITSTNPTLEEVSDIKTAVSEAVTNAIMAMRKVREKSGFVQSWKTVRCT